MNDESHAQALAIMRLYGPLIEVVSLADVLPPATSRRDRRRGAAAAGGCDIA